MTEGVNRVILVGNLGKDPETKQTTSGTPMCKFPLATTEKYKGEEKTEWHNIVVWGKTAEIAGQYLSKGRKVYLEGKIQTRSWDDEKSGQKRYMTEINAFKVIFLGGRDEGGQRREQDQPASQPQGPYDNGDDLPF